MRETDRDTDRETQREKEPAVGSFVFLHLQLAAHVSPPAAAGGT